MIEDLDISLVCDHYKIRRQIHQRLLTYLRTGDVGSYVPLALGMTHEHGNYSARDHGLGPRILSSSSKNTVFNFAQRLFECENPHELLKTIYDANLPFLKIGVGSEMAMMLRPNHFWVANVRSIWAHLLVKHGFNYAVADEEYMLYREQDQDSEMAYKIWREIYLVMEPDLLFLGKEARREATRMGLEPEELKYIWSDCIANVLYMSPQE